MSSSSYKEKAVAHLQTDKETYVKVSAIQSVQNCFSVHWEISCVFSCA